MKRPLSLLLAAAMLLASGVSQAQKLNPGEKKTLLLTPAVVYITVTYEVVLTYDSKVLIKQPITESGTGFIYRPDGYIVTAGHVVAHANLKDVQAQQELKQELFNSIFVPIIKQFLANIAQQMKRSLTDKEVASILQKIEMKPSTPKLAVYLANRKPYDADIKAYGGTLGEGKDIAIVKVDATNLPTVKLGNSDNLHLQEALTVIGYPGAAGPSGELQGILATESRFVPSITNGHVSAVKADYRGTPVIQTDAASTHGNSGGPAFNDAGEAIGVCDFGPNSVSGFSFFVPINTAWEFVRQAGSEPTSGLFNQLWSEALDLYDTGKCTAAKNKFTDVLRIIPGEPDAQRMSAAAEACSVNESPLTSVFQQGNPMIYGAVGVVIVLLVLFFVLRKKPAPAVAVGPAIAGGPQMGAVPPPAGVQMPPPGLPPSAHFGSVQITTGALSGRRFPITKEGLLIGRDPAKCQVVLNEDTVSKEHAWIVPVESGVVVIDRGSANGTFVNSPESPRVSKVGLQNGDRVYIGKQGAAVLTYYTS